MERPRLRSGTLRRLGRLGILLGAIAFILGAMLEPLVHSGAVRLGAPTLVGAESDAGGSSLPGPFQHDERGCVVCKLAGTAALLPSAPVAITTPSLAPASVVDADPPPPVFSLSPYRSRAPPYPLFG